MFKKVGLALLVATLPLFTSAQALGKTRTLLESASSIVTRIIIPLVFTLALLFFFWGIVKYIRSEGAGKAEGKQIMWWGIIALFVMSAVWGLVAYLRSELLGNDNTNNITVPTINGGSGFGGGPANS